MPGLSLSGSSSRSRSEQRADARTTARTSNRGGSARVSVTGDAGAPPTWLYIVGAVLVFLVIVALVL